MATVDTSALQLLRITAARIAVEEQTDADTLAPLFERAEETGDYYAADEARFDAATRSEERLGELLQLIEGLLATARA